MVTINSSVKEIMLSDYPRVAKDETLEHAVRIMDKYDLDRAVAVKSDKIVGIITKKDIMLKLATLRTRNVVPGRLHVSSFMTPDPITLQEDAKILDAVKLMVENNIGSVPITDGEKHPLGLITRWEPLLLAKKLSSLKAADVMTSIPEIVKRTHKVLHARQLLLKYDLIYMPVVDEANRLVGYITVDTIADAFLAFHDIVPEKHRKERIEHLLVDDIMRLRPLIAKPDDPLPDIVERILDKHVKGAVVVHNERIVGIITLKELVRAVLVHNTILS